MIFGIMTMYPSRIVMPTKLIFFLVMCDFDLEENQVCIILWDLYLVLKLVKEFDVESDDEVYDLKYI